MPDPFRPYSDPDTLTVIRTIGLAIIHDVAPEEELSFEKLADPIAKAYEEGHLIVSETDSKTYGGFGDIDPVTLVIVPVLIEILSELGKQLLTLGMAALKKSIDEKDSNKKKAVELIDVIVEQKYKLINQKVKSK